MKKLFKVIAVLIAIVVALLLIGSLLLHIYLPPEKAKALVLERLSTQLKREVEVGSVSVGLLSGLQMTHLKISESPNFSKGTFLSSDQFSLKIALPPLLFRKVIVRQIVLKHPEVNIIRFPDGKTFNFSDLTNATVPSPPAGEGGRRPDEGKSESLPFLLLVSRAEIQKGALHFIDRSPARQSVDITPFDLRLKNVSLTTPFSVQTSMHIKSKGSDLALDFAGEVNLVSGTFKIKQGSLVSQKSKVMVTGTMNNLKSSAPVVDLKVDIPRLNLANFKGFVSLPPALRIEGPFTGHANLSGDEKAMKFSVLLDGAAAKIQYASTFVKPVKTPFSISTSGILRNLSELEIQSLKAVLSALALSGHGKIPNLKTAPPAIVFHVESNAFPIEDLLVYMPGALPPGIVLKGTNKLSADVSGTSSSAQFAAKWDGTGLGITKADQFAKPAGLPMEVSIIGEMAGPNKIIVKNLAAKLLSNQLTGVGTYETRGADGVVSFAAKGVNWSVPELAKLSPLLAPYHPTGTLSFDLRANGPTSAPQTSVQTSGDVALANIKQEFYEGQNLHLKWNLSDVTPDLAKVSGTASFKQGPGKILNVEKLAESSRIGKIALAPLETLAKLQKKGVFSQVNLPSLQSIPFDSIAGDYLLRTGVMTIKTFDLNGKDLSVQDTGTVGLAGAQALNMVAVMKLAAGSIGGTLGNILQDENGRPTAKFLITGTMANPQVKLDLKETGQKAVQEVGKEIMKNKDVKDAVDGLQKTFQNIFH